MNDNIKLLIDKAVYNIIENTSSIKKLEKLESKHNCKIHFIPKRYRIFGGLLQSMNIQFGNFIEQLISLIIQNDGRYEIIQKYSGNRSNNFKISLSNENLIDEYISRCQYENINIDIEFKKLINNILNNNNDKSTVSFKHDIDLLFKDKLSKKIYYLEIKYNDDHDTGKFVDINRKFIKTYAYLSKELNVKTYDELIPIIFFFTNKKLKGNIYVPETTNIKRGKSFFDEFLNISYSDVDEYLLNLSENETTLSQFNILYNKVINNY